MATGTDPTDLSAGTGSQSTLTIQDGGSYSSAAGIRVHTPSSGGTATVNVIGQGSTLAASGFGSFNGTTTVNVRDGGVVDITSTTIFGGLGNAVYANALVTAVVSGTGSQWNSAGISLYKGSLSILAGGAVTGTAVSIASSGNPGIPDFGVLVSGEGSELSGTSMNLGTRGVGVLTIADGGTVVVNGGNSALTVGSAVASSDATLNIGGASGEAATTAGTLQASAVTLAASARVNFNHTGTGYVWGLPINGGGAINQYAGRTIFNTAQTGFTGLSTVHGGTLEVNDALGGTVDVRGGILAGAGSVGDTANYGGGAIAPGSNGIGTLTIAGNYAGNGGALRIEAELADDASPTDVLAITGNSIVGTAATRIFVTNVGGPGGQTTGDGIKIVDVAGTSDADAFVLGAPAIGGAYAYSLFQNGITDPADGDWYLRSAGIAPTVPVYENYPIVLLGLTELPTLRQRVGDRYWPGERDAGLPATAGGARAGSPNLWTRIEGAHSHVEGNSTTGLSYDGNRYLLQVGIDGLLAEYGSGMLIGGVNAQYGRIDADIASSLGTGRNATDSFGAGATLTWYGGNGFYLDGQASLTRLSSDLSADSAGRLVNDNRGIGYALSLEAGRKMPLSGNWSLTPQAQFAYASVDFDDFTDPYGADVSLIRGGDSLKGRAGLALDYEAGIGPGRSHVYAIANLTYEFLNGSAVDVAGVDVAFKPDAFGAEVGLGGAYRWAGGRHSVYGEALASSSFGGSYGFKGTVGFSTAF
jgi:fibronectin-binding autotransporter adhesin